MEASAHEYFSGQIICDDRSLRHADRFFDSRFHGHETAKYAEKHRRVLDFSDRVSVVACRLHFLFRLSAALDRASFPGLHLHKIVLGDAKALQEMTILPFRARHAERENRFNADS
ncbi:hypothetical protein [Pyramidobacter piscolens]|uniref:hypothetical protein n=1 Tax=Pyramidobacter piscolens TaxID=638849 RepID=UPI0012EA73CE|nr:hypothetical protein [Pyramidobacter piscolens]